MITARIKRIRGPGGQSAWLIEGTNLTIAEAIGDHELDELDVELTLGDPPPQAVAPTEAHSIAKTGITAT